jgi:phosphatidylglycerol:prolipoprotein diacylglycerol transferase
MGSPFYTLFLLAGIAGGAIFWSRLAKRDDRMMSVYIAALIGAFLGAKIAYVFSEGLADWNQPDRWWRLAAGKSITGALLFGYLSVEGAKKLLGVRSVTGDWFAAIVPSALALGRLGCFLSGCCQGKICGIDWFSHLDRHGEARYPAALAELIFNLAAVFSFFVFRRRGLFKGQHFHIYLIAYGLFRLLTEFWRDTPRIAGGFSGYQLFALLLFALGLVRFATRWSGERCAAESSENASSEIRKTTCKTVRPCAP